jgi:peptide/nickel transport system substrate-binding protein
MQSLTTNVPPSPPRRLGWRTSTTVLSLTLLTSLMLACAPTAPPASTSAPAPAPAEPAEALKPAAPAAPAPAAVATSPAAKPAAKPEPQGSVTIVLGEEPVSLASPDSYSSFGHPVLRNGGEALTNRDPKTNELVGELATKWEQTNPTTWRFHLRQGVTFHDGSPFNAESAAFGINYSWSKQNNYTIRGRVGPEFQAKAVDEYTLDVVTEAPDPILPTRLYFQPQPSQKAYEAAPDQFPLKPVGTGPYKFVEWVKGQYVKLTWNPDWWGNTNPAEAHGAATIKDVTFVFRPEREVRTAMVKRGEGDLARFVTAEQCKESPGCATGPAVETIFLRPDTLHPVFKDKRIREAMNIAVDRKTIVQDILGGGTPAIMLVGPSALGFNPALPPYPYDPERAKALVAAAKADGVPVDGPLTLLARRGSFIRIEEAAEAIGETYRQMGLTGLQVKILETGPYTEISNTRQTPERGVVFLNSHGNEFLDYSFTVNNYYTCDGRLSSYCDPKVDEMHKAAVGLLGEPRVKAYQDIAKYVYDDFGVVPLGQPNFYYGLSKRLDWAVRVDGFMLVKEMKLKE